MNDLRCNSKKHGVLLNEQDVFEVKCRSQFCGAGKNLVIIHRFDLKSGKMIETKVYRDPRKE